MSRQHVVTCYGCGSQFDANRGGAGYHRIKHKYYCPKCYKEIKREQKKLIQQERLLKRGMKQSYIAMVLKIVFGIISLFSFLYDKDPDTKYIFLLVGIILLAWGIVPFIKARRKK